MGAETPEPESEEEEEGGPGGSEGGGSYSQMAKCGSDFGQDLSCSSRSCPRLLCPKLRSASANWPLGPRWPAIYHIPRPCALDIAAAPPRARVFLLRVRAKVS